jgi:CheY-like chemotaxis protein
MQAQPSTPSSNDLTGLRVLVVDDEPDVCDLMTIMLRTRGAEIHCVASAPEGLATLQEWRPDVLIADLYMPHIDGLSLIRDVRSLPAEQGGNTPAITVTSTGLMKDVSQALALGYQLHIPKPFNQEDLVRAIAKLVQKPERVEVFSEVLSTTEDTEEHRG